MTFTATRLISRPPSTVHRILCDARTLTTWNPALGPLHPADATIVAGKLYRTLIRGFFPATITFAHVDEFAIEYRMRGAGAEEHGRWLLEPTGDGCSQVTHAFEHSGAFLRFLRNAFTDVPTWRLERLESQSRAW